MSTHTAYPIPGLPSIGTCRDYFQAAAILDAILCPEWEYRYYSFNARWDQDEQMASMRDGEGSHYFALFGDEQVMIKGYDKELATAKGAEDAADIVSTAPAACDAFLAEPAFIVEETTFLMWRLSEAELWQAGKPYTEQDYRLLEILTGGAAAYHAWAIGYYEIELDLALVEKVFAMTPIDEYLLQRLNPELTLDDLLEDLEEIGYPYQRDR
ncbi:hypothetical protein [Paenibacillus sp. 598K]|uniref:hypothetical protein n=1 Tax=Paenibacillus sp. 598K TaxID=1117987 RepID=UPI0021A9A4F8|nr:hypothetical protein [Paenibacillus sp. 598K]